MGISGVFSLPSVRNGGTGNGNGFYRPSVSSSAGKSLPGFFRLGTENSRVSVKARKFSGCLSSGFSDSGHMQYYLTPRAGEKKEKKNQSSSEMATMKKKLKLIKRLSKDLPMFSGMVYGADNEGGLVREVKGKMVLEAAEVLLAQLQHLRSEEKELKKKMKEQKALLKGAMEKTKGKCEPESSESSDSECGEAVNMNRLRREALKLYDVDEPPKAVEEASILAMPCSLIGNKNLVGEECYNETKGGCYNSNCCNNHQATIGALAPTERIEVCMGGKCKKMGAMALLKEFEEKVGVDGSVVGCKCMGRCKHGPNVRVSNCGDGYHTREMKSPAGDPVRSICMGVNLEDVGAIVANFLAEDQNRKGLMTTA